jgi:hypothetical protein
LDAPTLLTFNNAPVIVAKYETSIQTALFQQVQTQCLEERDQSIAYIRVFGELFGGKYEGYKNAHRAIQREIAYCPGIEFIVFDIECILTQESEGGKTERETETETEKEQKEVDTSQEDDHPDPISFFLTPTEVIQSCHSCQIPVLDILHSGTLTEMLELNQVFESTLPATLFNLPPTPNNAAEGYVLKPKSQVFYKPDQTRIMLKHKNPQFTENCNTKTTKVPKTPNNSGAHDLSEAEALIFEEMKQFINENRINAGLSKLDVGKKSKRKGVFFLIANDAHDDILLEMSQQLATMSSKDKNKLKKHLITYTEEYCDFHNIDFLL